MITSLPVSTLPMRKHLVQVWPRQARDLMSRATKAPGSGEHRRLSKLGKRPLPLHHGTPPSQDLLRIQRAQRLTNSGAHPRGLIAQRLKLTSNTY